MSSEKIRFGIAMNKGNAVSMRKLNTNEDSNAVVVIDSDRPKIRIPNRQNISVVDVPDVDTGKIDPIVPEPISEEMSPFIETSDMMDVELDTTGPQGVTGINCDHEDNLLPIIEQKISVQVKKDVYRGKEITIASLRFAGDLNAKRVIELMSIPNSKLSLADLSELAQYKAAQYENDINEWGEIAKMVLSELDDIPPIDYTAIYEKIERSSIKLKEEPSFKDCIRLIAQINNSLDTLTMLKVRLIPIMGTYEAGRSALADTWVAISLKSSDSTRCGEAKLILAQLEARCSKVKSLSNALDFSIKRLQTAWESVSRQVTAMTQELSGTRVPGDPVTSTDNSSGFVNYYDRDFEISA